MRFPYRVRDKNTQKNFDYLTSFLKDGSDSFGFSIGPLISVRFGVSAWSFPGGTRSSTPTAVQHGMGRAPKVLIVQTTNQFLNWSASTPTTTQFSSVAIEIDGGLVGASNIGFYWLAIG